MEPQWSRYEFGDVEKGQRAYSSIVEAHTSRRATRWRSGGAVRSGDKLLASTGADQTVRLWDVADGLERTRFRGHQGRVSCLSFPASGRYLASGSEQPGDVKIWDLTRDQEYISVGSSVEAFRSIDRVGVQQGW